MDEQKNSPGLLRVVIAAQLVILTGLIGFVVFREAMRTSLPPKNNCATTADSPGSAVAVKTTPAATQSGRGILPAVKKKSPPRNTTPQPRAQKQSHADEFVLFQESPKSPAVSKPLGPLKLPWIVIEKSRKQLLVYDGEVLVGRYPAAVGQATGDKQREGDLRTPEGEYYVCVRNPKSKYLLSLGLSYPNIKDAVRGLRGGLINPAEYAQITDAIRQGRQPSWKTRLGGAIMIHGQRLGGRDTLGCIALEDEDIRQLYPRIPLGTKVVIRP